MEHRSRWEGRGEGWQHEDAVQRLRCAFGRMYLHIGQMFMQARMYSELVAEMGCILKLGARASCGAEVKDVTCQNDSKVLANRLSKQDMYTIAMLNTPQNASPKRSKPLPKL